MAQYIGDHNIVPVSVRAKTASGLENKIRQLQLMDGCEYKFISFYFDPVKGEHVGWYYVQKTDQEIIQGALNGNATE
jgi:hypothetical protein